SHFEGNVIETKIDKGKGIMATIIVKTGILRYGVQLFEDDRLLGKVRSLHDEWGKQVKEAGPGQPVEITGLHSLPDIGVVLRDLPLEKADLPDRLDELEDFIPDFLKPIHEVEQRLPVFIKADTTGSLEAIQASIPEKIEIISSGLGDITEADILLAKSAGAIVLGFNVSIRSSAVKLADIEKVVYRTYTIIYELLDELRDVASGLKEITSGEREIGQAVVLAEFPFNKQRVAGVKVSSGRIAKGDTIKLMRNDNEVGRARIASIRQGKLDVTKVEAGQECGILFDKNIDFSLQDVIISVIK
ncbi:MAG: hypothetical protein N3A54_05010, partial [Patescibacteria group bacterium]|nr:hypothetical protein [Patescibacteria group bacterium]